MSLSSNTTDMLVPTMGSDEAESSGSPAYGGSANAFGYQFLDLNTSSHQVRLLRFSPSSPLKIECTMYTMDLESVPLYWALSYTWGPPEPTMEIMVNGKPMRIRENLYQFLSTWRNTLDRDLWIDQICIDQRNDHEKNHQVNMMSQIFTAASNVLIWLGVAADDSDRVIAAVTKSPRATAWEQVEHEQDGLLRIMERQYWHRLWVVQEILLAPCLTVLCGTQEFSWSELDEWMHVLQHGRRIHDMDEITWSGRGSTANIISMQRTRFQLPRLQAERPRSDPRALVTNDVIASRTHIHYPYYGLQEM